MNTDFCTNYPTLYIFSILRKSFRVLVIIIPLIIIVIGMIDFFKAVLDKDDDSIKKATNALIKRIIAGIVIFIMPTLVESLFNVFNESFVVPLDLASCIENSDNLAFYKELYEKEKKNQISKDERENEIEAERLRKEAEKKKENSKKYFIPRYNPSTPDGGSNKGRKYNISDSDLKKIATIARCEQGSSENGMKAQVSLFANNYELNLLGSKWTSLTDMLIGSSATNQIQCARCFNGVPNTNCSGLDYSESNTTIKEIEYVRDVLNNGNRTLPQYVDEHDCIDCYDYIEDKGCENHNRGDICYIVNDGVIISDMSELKKALNYIPNKTIIHNRYGSTYTFVLFPYKGSDPFGYSKNAYNNYQRNQDKPNYID